MSSTICAAFWKHVNLRPGDRIFPCCRFKNAICKFDGDLDQTLQHQAYQQLRQQSLSGEIIDGCQKCYHEEQHGQKSLRQRFNEEYNTNEVKLEYFEVGFDNVCNLACDGCGPEFSHTWAQKLDPSAAPKIHINTTTELKTIPDQIKKVFFLGGEPLMTNQHRRFLEKLNNLSKVEIVYNTNGMFLLDQISQELLLQARHVKFIVSIDAVGIDNQKVRQHSNWNNIMLFIEQLKTLGFEFVIHTTLHSNNYAYLINLSEWIHENKYSWTVNPLTNPPYLDIANQSILVKQEISKIFDTCNNLPDRAYLINHLRNNYENQYTQRLGSP